MELSKSYTVDKNETLNQVLYGFKIIIIGLFLTSSLACTVKKSAEETPAPNIQNVSKDFFIDPINGKSRLFLCGAASETEVGQVSAQSVTHGIQSLGHCNIAFEIQERALIGRMVNPSFPTEANRWEVAITIPISKHYYYEKVKDEYGRETNKYIENSERSHWSARPYIKLELSGIEFQKVSYSFFWSGMKAFSVEDIEWDHEKKFLGFSVSGLDTYFKSEYQVKFRMNFLELIHNEKFEKTPFNDQNYKYMNVLHVIGHKYDGLRQVMYAAHWDLSKTHKVSLYGFPDKDTEKIAEDVVTDWNQTLQKIGAVENGKKAFEINSEKPKHFFDLRYPTIYWVSDKRISAYSPLGVGVALADLQNGEIQWGGITLYGGGIESYVKQNMALEVDSASAAEGAKSVAYTLDQLQSQTEKMPSLIDSLVNANNESLFHSSILNSKINNLDISAKKDLNKNEKTKFNSEFTLDASTMTALQQQFQYEKNKDANILKNINLAKILNLDTNLETIAGKSGSDSSSVNEIYSSDSFMQNTQWKSQNHKYLSQSANGKKYLNAQYYKSFLSSKDLDRNFSMMAPLWKQAVSAVTNGQNKISLDEALRRVHKELISHEYGHFLGLGHQFKENILPDPDKVPEAIYKQLAAKSTAKNKYLNKTSIMGYRRPEVEMATNYQDIIPGPQDELVLRYMYKKEISLFNKGDKDFSFVPIDESGVIPKSIKGKSVSYFPQCNDMDASFNFDPYCNRFDKGTTATEIITEYLNDFKANLVQSIFQFGDSRTSDGELIEYYLAHKAFEQFGRVRLFYDFMRSKYKNAFVKIFENNNDVFAFSKDCVGTDGSDDLKKVVKANPGLSELCSANKIAVKGFLEILTLPISDYTKLDMDNRFVPGGMSGGEINRDYSKLNGSWTEIGGFPMKLAAMYALTSNNPWTMLFGFPYPVFSYNNPDHRYNYSSVFIDNLVSAVADGVKNNLRFSLLGDAVNSSIGKSVLFLGMLMNQLTYSNDTLRVNYDLFEKIKEQSQFEIALNFIIISPPDSGATNLTKTKILKGEVYDFRSNEKSTLNSLYILPNGGYIALEDNAFLLPVGKLMFTRDNIQVGLILKTSFSSTINDQLAIHSVKKQLWEKYYSNNVMCIEGKAYENNENNGLRTFFNEYNPKFEGFYLPKNIKNEGLAGINTYNATIRKSFETYVSDPAYGKSKPELKNCFEAVKASGMILATAAILNGYFTSLLIEGMEK